METLREDFDSVEFANYVSTARALIEIAAQESATSHQAREVFFSSVIGHMLYGDIDNYIGRGSALEWFGHLIYHTSSSVPPAERRNIIARISDQQPSYEPLISSDELSGSFATIEENRLVWWVSLEDWRTEWESDPYGFIPDISIFRKAIGPGSAGLPAAPNHT